MRGLSPLCIHRSRLRAGLTVEFINARTAHRGRTISGRSVRYRFLQCYPGSTKPREPSSRLGFSRSLLLVRDDFFEQQVPLDRRERTVIPEHFSPYKYTPYNIVIQIPTTVSRCIRPLRPLVTPPLWDIVGAEHRSRWGYQETPRYTRQWSYRTETPSEYSLRFLEIPEHLFFFYEIHRSDNELWFFYSRDCTLTLIYIIFWNICENIHKIIENFREAKRWQHGSSIS